ncbi:HAMP domain-containing methyl-accepting chemotaxis protein [Magnetococcales bacterium HHB-1]
MLASIEDIPLKRRFLIILLVIVALSSFFIYSMFSLSEQTEKLYRHPYTVSTSVLRITGDMITIHSHLQEIVLIKDLTEIHTYKQKINTLEAKILQGFEKVNERFLGDKTRVQQARQLFLDWKPVRNEVIEALDAGNREQGIAILHDRGNQAMRQLTETMESFVKFAHNKANRFRDNALTSRNYTLGISLVILVVVLLLGWSFAHTITLKLQKIIKNITESSTEIGSTIAEQERVAAQQTTSINETNTTMEELGASSRQSAEQAESAANNTHTVLELAQDGVSRVESMLHSMEETKEKVEAIAQQILKLSEQTSQIGSITNTVTDFANETKMLAMNAAVEAVRAGEHGKGFSVLSVEIRKLADESKRSAERINNLVEEIQRATNTTVMVTEEGTKKVNAGMGIAQSTADTFHKVTTSVNSASESAQQISMNIRQQAVAVKQVVESMRSLTSSSEENTLGISQVKDGIHGLKQTSDTLRKMI